MKKTGFCRFLCLCFCLLLALSAAGAGKPVVPDTLFEETGPSVPEPDAISEPETTPEENVPEEPVPDAEAPADPEEPADEAAEAPADAVTEGSDIEEPTPEFDFSALQTFGEGLIDGELLTGNDAVPTVEGYADVILADTLSVTFYDAESFRSNPALIGKAVRVDMPDGLSLTLRFAVTAPARRMTVFRLGENGTVCLDAQRDGDELSVPLTESGVYFVTDTNRLMTLLGLSGGATQNAGKNTVLLDDFHYVTLNAPLQIGSDADTDGDDVPDCEEIGEAYALDLGSGTEVTVYAFRSDPTLPDTDFDGIPDAFDAAPNSNLFTGKMKSGHDGTTTVSFTVDFRNFFADNTGYQATLASFSVMGAALAYQDKTSAYDNAYFTFDTAQTWSGGTASKVNGLQIMQVFGFEDVKDYKLGSVYSDDDLCEMLIGHQTVTYNGQTKVIIGIWVRGTDSVSEEEWSSNFHMGDLVRFFDEYDSVAGKTPRQSNADWTRKNNHRGFDVCATRLLRYLSTYYKTYIQPILDSNADYAASFWLTGHSRGAAVSNLMASYLIDEEYEAFAYTFAAPYNTANTEASAEKYDSIFNLVNANDFIPMLPMPEWGFTRYGKTANVDASQYASQIKTATGEDYSGKYLTSDDMSTLLNKFICITGENADRDNPGKILGWREVYVYHCGHTHEGETVGNYQSTTFVKKQSITNWFGPSESDWNGYATRLKKYSHWNDGICETPAYDLQVLVELMVAVANGETLSGASTFITSNKLADKFDFDKWSLVSYATKLTEPHFMDTYSVIQAQINAAGNPGSRFATLPYYTASNASGGRPLHTHTYTYVPYDGQAPTCEEDGFGYRYCLCSEANADYYDDYQKNVTIPALGHEWTFTGFTWTGDDVNGYTGATANYVCSRDASHLETASAAVTIETIEPTAASEGRTVYTAAVSQTDSPDGIEHADSKTVILPVLTPAFRGQSLTLSGEIGLNFFVEFPEGVDKENSYVIFTIGMKALTERDDFDVNHTNVLNGVTRYGFTCHTNSLQMADTVTATLYYTVTGSSDVRTVQKQYSVKQYIDYYEPYLNGSQVYSDSKLIDLLKALADYGHYAQLFLDDVHDNWSLGVDYTAMNGYTAEYEYNAVKSATSNAVFTKELEGSAVESAGIALALDSNTALRIVLTMKDNTTKPYITVNEQTINPGESYTTPEDYTYSIKLISSASAAKPQYEVRISGIRAQNLERTFTISGNANGAFSVSACPLYYVNYILNLNPSNMPAAWNAQHAYDCVAALYHYYDAVKKYRTN